MNDNAVFLLRISYSVKAILVQTILKVGKPDHSCPMKQKTGWWFKIVRTPHKHIIVQIRVSLSPRMERLLWLR
jgi:hypothetical protein